MESVETPKSILIINHYAGSYAMGMEFRPLFLAKEWKKNGHTVNIVAGSYSHLRQMNPSITSKTGELQNIDGVAYFWVKTCQYKKNGLIRFLSILQFCFKSYIFAKRIVNQFMPDYVIASSTYPFDIFPAKRIARLSKAKLVHELHDMWPMSLIELGGMSKNHPFVKLVQIVENYTYRTIDAEVSILENTKDYMVTHGLDESKFHHVGNGVCLDRSEEIMPLAASEQSVIRQLREKVDFICCFFGSHTKSYGLEILIDAKREIPNLGILFVGDGEFKDSLVNKVMKEKTPNVVFLDPLQKAKIPSLLSQIDYIYIGTNGSPLFRYGLSMNKLFDAMYSGKPIILSADSPGNLVEKSQCGIIVQNVTVETLRDALRKMMNYSEDERLEMGQKGKEYVVSHCTYSKISNNYLEILDRI